MGQVLNIIFAVSLMFTFSLSAYAWFLSRKHEESFSNLALLGLALAQMVFFHFLGYQIETRFFALALVGWVWPLFVLRRIFGLNERWHLGLLGVAGFISLALASYQMGFFLSSLPFVLSYGALGIYLSISVRRSGAFIFKKELGWIAFLSVVVFFANRLCFPLWAREPDLLVYGYLIDFAGFLGLGFSLLLGALESQHEQTHLELKRLGDEQNAKLLGTSKYSELGMMSAGIAHEINNPLAVIQARTTQLLRIYKNPTKAKELGEGLEQILFTSERINRTIQGVREFVHQDDRALPEDLVLKDVVEDVLTFCGQRMKNHGVNLRFYGIENHRVRGNKIQLEQVILNLLNNSFDAIEFLPDKWIELSVQQDHKWLQIFVKDSGSGIPKEIAAHIMDPFYSTKDIGKGTGLGLALAKGILEKHGGRLRYLAESSHTTFMMELPSPGESAWSQEFRH